VALDAAREAARDFDAAARAILTSLAALCDAHDGADTDAVRARADADGGEDDAGARRSARCATPTRDAVDARAGARESTDDVISSFGI